MAKKKSEWTMTSLKTKKNTCFKKTVTLVTLPPTCLTLIFFILRFDARGSFLLSIKVSLKKQLNKKATAGYFSQWNQECDWCELVPLFTNSVRRTAQTSSYKSSALRSVAPSASCIKPKDKSDRRGMEPTWKRWGIFFTRPSESRRSDTTAEIIVEVIGWSAVSVLSICVCSCVKREREQPNC